MRLIRVLKETTLPGSGGFFGASSGPLVSKLVTAEIASTDGKPLFSSVFFNGTPMKRAEWEPHTRNQQWQSEAEAIAGHDAMVARLTGKPSKAA